jgi:hypothetical protein
MANKNHSNTGMGIFHLPTGIFFSKNCMEERYIQQKYWQETGKKK